MPAAANRKPRGTAAGRAPRPDGQATRQRLLEVACQMFAERGYADTTSKEICERAGTPLASVNYHFGSRDALYAAVLVEAHNRVASLDDIVRVTQGPGSPQQRLAALLGFVVNLAARTNAPWALRLLLREIMSPSAAVPRTSSVAGLIVGYRPLPPGTSFPSMNRSLLPSAAIAIRDSRL